MAAADLIATGTRALVSCLRSRWPCGGFVQQVYRLNGVRLGGDAHQQAVEGGRNVIAIRRYLP